MKADPKRRPVAVAVLIRDRETVVIDRVTVEEAPVDVIPDILQHRELRFEEHCVVPVPLMAHETAFELKVRKLRVKERYSVVFVEVVLVTIHRNGVAEGAVQNFAHVGPPEIHPGSVVGGDKKLPAILRGRGNGLSQFIRAVRGRGQRDHGASRRPDTGHGGIGSEELGRLVPDHAGV